MAVMFASNFYAKLIIVCYWVLITLIIMPLKTTSKQLYNDFKFSGLFTKREQLKFVWAQSLSFNIQIKIMNFSLIKI